jgi:hypothetical protein
VDKLLAECEQVCREGLPAEEYDELVARGRNSPNYVTILAALNPD